jgi:hypothetical protein
MKGGGGEGALPLPYGPLRLLEVVVTKPLPLLCLALQPKGGRPILSYLKKVHAAQLPATLLPRTG